MMRAQRSTGFSLIELLIVLAIAGVIAGMFASVGPQGRAEVVRSSAEQVAAVLRRARTMALANHEPYMVTFNLANAPGSSGRVLNNRSGGHWCRIVRASRINIGDSGGFSCQMPPVIAGFQSSHATFAPYPKVSGMAWNYAGTMNTTEGWTYIFPDFPHVVEEIRSCAVSERLTLPPGKVRFLAFGDSDEGPRYRSEAWDAAWGGPSAWNAGYGTTYPRPYFGYFDAVARRLYPWGGYDPGLPAVTPFGASAPGPIGNYSGLFYQATTEAPITDSRHPADRVFQVDWNGDGAISGSDVERGSEAAWYLARRGDSRPLIDGDWGDFVIVFNPDGTAFFPPMKCSRRFYRTDNGTPITGLAFAGGGGACDLAKPWQPTGAEAGVNTICSVPNGESIHYQRHTGKAFITLAPDTLDDQDSFSSPEAALHSMMPMCRVAVSLSGTVEVVQVRRNEQVLSEMQARGLGSPWPADPAIFAMAAAADQTWIEQNFRWGWLHAPTTGWRGYQMLKPIGTPITDQVSTAMLTRRIWWMKP